MKNTYDLLDFGSAEAIAHEVAHLLSENDLYEACDGHLFSFFQQWYDALDYDGQRSLHACIKVYFTQDKHLNGDSCRDIYFALRELMAEVHEQWPELLCSIPEDYRLNWTDVETKKQSIIRCASGFVNRVLAEREASREWLQDCCLLGLREPLPALEARSPQEIGQQLDAGNPEDLDLVEDIRILFEDREGIQWSTKVFIAMHSAFEAKHTELPLSKLLDNYVLWSDRFSVITSKQLPVIVEAIIKRVSATPNAADFLDDHQATALICCADKAQQWEVFPEDLRLSLFSRLLSVSDPEGAQQFLDSIPGKRLLYVPKVGQANPAKDRRFWLSRPDADLYANVIFEWIARQSPEHSVSVLDQLAKCAPDYSTAINERLTAVIKEFAAGMTKLPLGAATALLETSYLHDIIDVDELAGIHLGRMRQHAKGDKSVDFPLYFGRAYEMVLNKAPLKAFTRLADAIIAAGIPVSEEDLSFSDDINELYLMPSYPHLKHHSATPGTWLMKQFFEWIFRFIPDLVAVERGPLKSHRHGDLTLADVRRTWAELCWRKLDIKKTSKKKPAKDLTPDDQLESRSTWRMAHLKSLADLGDDLGNKAHRRIHAISKSDPDSEVREVATAVYNKTLRERMKSAENPLYSFIKVTLWFRVANRESLKLGIDQKAATRTRNQELRLAKAVDEKSM